MTQSAQVTQVTIKKTKQLTAKTKDDLVHAIKGVGKTYASGTFQGVHCTGFINQNKTTITVFSTKKELGMWYANVYDITLNESMFKAIKQGSRDFVMEGGHGVAVRVEK